MNAKQWYQRRVHGDEQEEEVQAAETTPVKKRGGVTASLFEKEDSSPMQRRRSLGGVEMPEDSYETPKKRDPRLSPRSNRTSVESPKRTPKSKLASPAIGGDDASPENDGSLSGLFDGEEAGTPGGGALADLFADEAGINSKKESST
eukprot:TRINITY_DN5160_c0_g1_i1.p1 TRINITY_DN5160_c0_g1~~TRINITY_DN5160_c0_g1_i1.p1  ORF type:complete len:147 (+),score=44.63 TRINITY_DN5160_c0_g1_i1:19-459(+)